MFVRVGDHLCQVDNEMHGVVGSSRGTEFPGDCHSQSNDTGRAVGNTRYVSRVLLNDNVYHVRDNLGNRKPSLSVRWTDKNDDWNWIYEVKAELEVVDNAQL